MVMQVEDNLAGAGAVIDLHAEVSSPIDKQFADFLHGVGQLRADLRRSAEKVGVVLFGADQKVGWCFGCDVVEDDDVVILIEYSGVGFSFDDLAEDAEHGGKNNLK